MTTPHHLPVSATYIAGPGPEEGAIISSDGEIVQPSPYPELANVIVETALLPWVTVTYCIPDGSGNCGTFHNVTYHDVNETWRAKVIKNRREGFGSALWSRIYHDD